jgi:hypothetical protein
MTYYIRDNFGYDENGLKEWIYDPITGDTFTRCDNCGKLHDEMDLKESVSNVTIASEESKVYKLICKPCEDKQ